MVTKMWIKKTYKNAHISKFKINYKNKIKNQNKLETLI